MSLTDEVAAFFTLARHGGRWWELAAMRSLLGAEAAGSVALGHAFGPDERRPAFAFLAADTSAAHAQSGVKVRRSLVFLHPGLLLRFGLGAALDSPGGVMVEKHSFGGRQIDVLSADTIHTRPLASIDLDGTLAREWAVFFHNEPASAQSALYFDNRQSGESKYLVTGVAPGQWQIWRNGWLEDTIPVAPRSGALYFEGRAGSYFLRRLG